MSGAHAIWNSLPPPPTSSQRTLLQLPPRGSRPARRRPDQSGNVTDVGAEPSGAASDALPRAGSLTGFLSAAPPAPSGDINRAHGRVLQPVCLPICNLVTSCVASLFPQRININEAAAVNSAGPPCTAQGWRCIFNTFTFFHCASASAWAFKHV